MLTPNGTVVEILSLFNRLLAAAFYNLSQLMRKLFGFGTPKQLAAAMERVNHHPFCLWNLILALLRSMIDAMTAAVSQTRLPLRTFQC